jgi:hypothetical protein
MVINQPEVPETPPAPSGAPAQTDRRAIVRDDIERRLRKVCANFSDEDFRELVDLMTDRKLKSERTKLS